MISKQHSLFNKKAHQLVGQWETRHQRRTQRVALGGGGEFPYFPPCVPPSPPHSPPSSPPVPPPLPSPRVRRAPPRRVRRGLPLGWGSGGLTPGKFLKSQIAVGEFWRISDQINMCLFHRYCGQKMWSHNAF